MESDARIRALEAENERLRDELETLKSNLGMDFVAPLEFRLTPHETKILGRLMKGGPVNKRSLMDCVYTKGIDDEPEIKIVDVFVCKMRKKVKPFGMEIKTIWGVGYQLSPDSKALFEERWGKAA